MSDTSHVYGCEHPGCSEMGERTRVWNAWGYPMIAYLCPAHSDATAVSDNGGSGRST